MIKNEWGALSVEEKAKVILSGKLSVETRTGVDGLSRVGDVKTVTQYCVKSGDVRISEWFTEPEDALSQASESLSNWREVLN